MSKQFADLERYFYRYYDDSSNSYKYIIFVLVIYAVSFMGLMVKYFWRSQRRLQDGLVREENLYDEFVKRDSFRGRMVKEKTAADKAEIMATAAPVPLKVCGALVEQVKKPLRLARKSTLSMLIPV